MIRQLYAAAALSVLMTASAGVARPDLDTPGTNELVALARLDVSFAPTVYQERAGESLDAAMSGASRAPAFGARGSRRIYYHGGGGLRLNNSDEFLVFGGVGVSHFIADDLSLNVELNGMYFDQQPPDDAFAVNANVLFRWHVYPQPTWSFYLDGGSGVLVATAEVPRKGSNFNFTPQAGMGFSFEVADDTRMLFGVRWHHVSNGSLYSDNPGQDSVIGYFGLTVPF